MDKEAESLDSGTAPNESDAAAEPPPSEPPEPPSADSAPSPEPASPPGNGSPESIALPSLGAAENGTVYGINGGPTPESDEPSLSDRLKTLIIGKPRNLADQSIFKHVSLVAFLAWVGLGADGLSSSCYGPPEAFMQSRRTSLTWRSFWPWPLPPRCSSSPPVTATSSKSFPAAAAATWWPRSCLGDRVGVVSGCALLVDYVLTITVSIAAAGDALFGLMGPTWFHSEWKLYAEFAAIVVLIRPESARRQGIGADPDADLPAVPADARHPDRRLVAAALARAPATWRRASRTNVHTGLPTRTSACSACLGCCCRPILLGAGTYTGIEAVSNSMPVMREPRVATAKRTMRYMAFSLAFTAGGLIVAYLLLGIRAQRATRRSIRCWPRRLSEERGLGDHWLGMGFVLADADFGRRAVVRRRPGRLHRRPARAGQHGPRLLDAPLVLQPLRAAGHAQRHHADGHRRARRRCCYTHGNIHTLVIMYSINVFVTFSLSMIGMCRHWYALRGENPLWRRRLALFVVGAVLCVSILAVDVYEKVRRKAAGDTRAGHLRCASCVAASSSIATTPRRRKPAAARRDARPTADHRRAEHGRARPRPAGGRDPGGRLQRAGHPHHAQRHPLRPRPFQELRLRFRRRDRLGQFQGQRRGRGAPRNTARSRCKSTSISAGGWECPPRRSLPIGTDAVDELEQACLEIVHKFPKATFFAGQLVFQKDTWLHRLLHNQTAYSLQRRLQWAGVPMVILPTRVR